MRKAQSYIVEFIIFFGVSFTLFVTISYLFYNQNRYLGKTVGESGADLINDLTLNTILNTMKCKSCDNLTVSEDIPSRIGGFFYTTELDSTGLRTTLIGGGVTQESTVFNLDKTFTLSGTSKSKNKKTGIRINYIGLSPKIEVE